MQPLKWLRKFSRNERGNAIVICAATLPLVIGSAAIGVDTIQVSLARRQLQRSADSAAIAGAYAKHAEQDVTTAVNHDLSLNNNLPLSDSEIEDPPSTGPYADNPRAVRVVFTTLRSVPFISFFTNSQMTVRVEATAASVYTGEYCLVSLEDGNVSGAVSAGGNATVNLGCGMISNSTSSSAVTTGGSSTVIASPVAAVGGVPSSSNYGPNTVLLPYSPSQPDPFADLPMPPVPAGCPNQRLQVQPGQTATVTTSSPGYMGGNVYCWSGMDIKGTVVLPPNSVIIVNGGELDFGAQSNVTGSGVTFLLTSANAATQPSQIAELKINAGAQLNLTAPDSGPYAGVLMYQDRRATYDTEQINGNASTFFRGAFYFPSRQLVFNGTAGMSTDCVQMVARRLSFSGNASINNSCPENSGSHAFEANFVRLVG